MRPVLLSIAIERPSAFAYSRTGIRAAFAERYKPVSNPGTHALLAGAGFSFDIFFDQLDDRVEPNLKTTAPSRILRLLA